MWDKLLATTVSHLLTFLYLHYYTKHCRTRYTTLMETIKVSCEAELLNLTQFYLTYFRLKSQCRKM